MRSRKLAMNHPQKMRLPRAEKEAEPCPKMRHGPVSQKRPIPCPKNGQSRVPKWDTNPVREPLRNQRAGAPPGAFSEIAVFWAEKIAAGGHVPDSVLTETLKSEIRATGILTEAQMAAHGIVDRKRAG